MVTEEFLCFLNSSANLVKSLDGAVAGLPRGKWNFGKTFSLPETIIDGGLEILDNVEAGDVEADEALEVAKGVKTGEGVKTEGGEIGDAVGDAKVDVNDADDGTVVVKVDKGVVDKLVIANCDAAEGKPVVEIGMSRIILARGV
jgi:hypothetical protein